MIDELGDPMIHMVRNAADHGIESPEVRAAAGKPRARHHFARRLPSRQQHRHPRVRRRPRAGSRPHPREGRRERAASRPADAERMTPQQIYQLIWLPGLSTAEKVTEVSGRGVGMDIVRSKIEDLNGSVELESEPGGARPSPSSSP